MDKQVVKKNSAGALTSLNFRADSGKGAEEIKSADVSTPILKILHQLSPECNTRSPKHVEGAEGKTIIWSHYTHDVKRIISEIKKVYGDDSVVDYYGATDTDARSKNIKKFQTNDKCRFFVGTTHTGGYGITLTAGSNMIYYSNGYDLEKRQQSEARIDRIGQTKKMTYIDIMAQDTIDERIVKALRSKVNIANAIMKEDYKEWI